VNEQPKNRKPHRLRYFFLGIDAWLDTTLYRTGETLRTRWDAFNVWMRRWQLSGVSRLFIELVSDAATFGTLGSVLALALALPAFESTETDWRTRTDYSITFLDRFGNEVGKRGILQNDTVPLDEIPDAMIKSLLATLKPPLTISRYKPPTASAKPSHTFQPTRLPNRRPIRGTRMM